MVQYGAHAVSRCFFNPHAVVPQEISPAPRTKDKAVEHVHFLMIEQITPAGDKPLSARQHRYALTVRNERRHGIARRRERSPIRQQRRGTFALATGKRFHHAVSDFMSAFM
jgi:hypothetical protein